MIQTYPDLPERDIGFGSAYERHALYGLLERQFAQWDCAGWTGLEGFYDCFAGLPGLHLLPLARRGGRITVACQSERMADQVRTVYRQSGLADRLETFGARLPSELPPDRRFDVAFLFNPFPFVENWPQLLADTAARASRYLIVSVCSRQSYGIVFRRLLKTIKPSSGEGLDLFAHPTSDPVSFRRDLSAYGRIILEDYFDAPWWPDFYGGPGDTVLTWMLKQTGIKLPPRPTPPPVSADTPQTGNHAYTADTFPYFRELAELTALRQKIRRHPSFDHWKFGLPKSLFAHHRIFVVQRPSAA